VALSPQVTERPPRVPGEPKSSPTQILREVAERSPLRRLDNLTIAAALPGEPPNHRRLPVTSLAPVHVKAEKKAPGRRILF
jgi:hypothetical protein